MVWCTGKEEFTEDEDGHVIGGCIKGACQYVLWELPYFLALQYLYLGSVILLISDFCFF